MAKLMDILRHRWPEALLIIVFQAAGIILSERALAAAFETGGSRMPEFMVMLLLAGGTCFGVLWLMLILGFLRTVAEKAMEYFEPAHLLVEGRHFFWRVVLFKLILGVITIVFSFALYFLAGHIYASVTGSGTEGFPVWIQNLSGAAVLLFLAKPLLLTQAFLVARDCSLSEALLLTRNTRIIHAALLLRLFLIWLIVSFSVAQMRMDLSDDLAGLLSIGFYAIVKSVLTLMVQMAAVLYVTDPKNRR